MKSTDMQHLGLGNIPATVGLTKSNLMHSAKLGVGAAAGITLTNLLLSKVLVKGGQPMVPMAYSPLAVALGGIALGALTKKFARGLLKGFAEDLGDGMIAGTVGSAVFSYVERYTAPAAAVQAVVAENAELQGYGPQAGSAGVGRAFASGLAGLNGGARQLAGATIAMEDSGPMSGEGLGAVAFEDINAGAYVS
jgi:hypothetical protein